MNQFNKVFGTNSPQVVKVMSGQAGWGQGSGMNQMCQYHMACLQTTICNPWSVKIDAYAIAPYWNASDHTPTGTEASMRAGLADCVTDLNGTRAALVGSGIPLVCYEGGPDNYSTQGIADNSFQYQLTIDALNAFAPLVQGIFNYYTFNGGAVWGLKDEVGQDPATMPKWRGYMQWLSQNSRVIGPSVSKAVPALLPGPVMLCNLQGQRLDFHADDRGFSLHNGMGVFVETSGNRIGKTVRVR